MNSSAGNFMLGVDFKVAIERRCIEVVESGFVAPKEARQCENREAAEADSKKHFNEIDRREMFVCALNEIQKYDWDIIASEPVYQINIPGYDVSYYYVDAKATQTHVLRYFVICYFISSVSSVVGDGGGDAATVGGGDVAGLAKVARKAPALSPKMAWVGPAIAAPFATWPSRWRALARGTVLVVCSLVVIVTVAFVALHWPKLPSGPIADSPPPPPRVAEAPAPEGGAPSMVPAPSAVGGLAPVVPSPAVPGLPALGGMTPAGTDVPLAASGPPKPKDGLDVKLGRGGNARILLLQRSLANLGFYHGSLTGVNGPKTRKAAAEFLRAVPLDVQRRYGKDNLGMAEAALRGEFALGVVVGGRSTPPPASSPASPPAKSP